MGRKTTPFAEAQGRATQDRWRDRNCRLRQPSEMVQRACVAKIFIEQALTDPPRREKLGSELAQRCQALLDERVLCDLRGVAEYKTAPHACSSPWSWWFQKGAAGHAWFQSSGWQERSARLFALARWLNVPALPVVLTRARRPRGSRGGRRERFKRTGPRGGGR